MRRYGVARGALARVLNGLVLDNVIERRSGHGWRFLPALDATQLHEDSYRFRLLIEPACVLEPTFRLDKARAQRLRQIHVELLSDGLEKLSSGKFFELNAEFHEFVASCSRNRFLEQAVIHQNRLRRFFSYIAVFAPERMRVSFSEHVAILDRLMAGEREHAATLLWRHLLGSSRVKPRFLRPSSRPLTDSSSDELLVLVVYADVVVLEVAGELGRALVLEQPLEAAPRGIADLLTPALGHVELFVDLSRSTSESPTSGSSASSSSNSSDSGFSLMRDTVSERRREVKTNWPPAATA